MDNAVARRGPGLGAAEDGVDEVVVGRLWLAGDRRVFPPLPRSPDVDPCPAPAVGFDAAAVEDEMERRPFCRTIAADQEAGQDAVLKSHVDRRVNVHRSAVIVDESEDLGDISFDRPADAVEQVGAAVVHLAAAGEGRVLPPGAGGALLPVLGEPAGDGLQLPQLLGADHDLQTSSNLPDLLAVRT